VAGRAHRSSWSGTLSASEWRGTGSPALRDTHREDLQAVTQTSDKSQPRSWSARTLFATASVVHFALAALAVPASGAHAQGAPRATTKPTISGIRAHLFHNKTGRLSDVDILGSEQPGLWNTVAGPDAAKSTLVIVEVSGPPSGTFTGYFGPETKYMVRLVAREGRSKLLLDQRQTIPVLSDQGKVSLAFLVHQGGCAPVHLTATLVGAHSGKPLERSLNFACGE
jgi:hypothetical protein